MPDKQLYIEKHEAKMDQWEAQLQKLRAKAAETSTGLKIDFQKQTEKLQPMMEAHRKKLRELRHSSGDAWKELKSGFDTTFKDLETTWAKMVAAFQ